MSRLARGCESTRARDARVDEDRKSHGSIAVLRQTEKRTRLNRVQRFGLVTPRISQEDTDDVLCRDLTHRSPVFKEVGSQRRSNPQPSRHPGLPPSLALFL